MLDGVFNMPLLYILQNPHWQEKVKSQRADRTECKLSSTQLW